MLPFTHEDWLNVCNMYFNQKNGVQKSYLQWYPFSILTRKDKEIISDKAFFEKNIKCGLFSINKNNWLITDNYMQKEDGSFRDSSLISPILYLILQCIGKIISKFYESTRPENISTFYAGNYINNRCYYKQDYDEFYKLVNAAQDSYRYYIKTDIRDFFGNINVNKLFVNIDRKINDFYPNIKQKDLLLFKEILLYCGKGKFPLAENSIASSFLATIVYLDEVDQKICSFLKDKVSDLVDFHMARYVDDLYILFNSKKDISNLNPTYNEIINECSSILKDFNLALNIDKCSLKKTSEISNDLKKSLYDEYARGIQCRIPEFASEDNIINFLNTLKTLIINGELTANTYTNAIYNHFKINEIEFTPLEVYNYFLYEKQNVFRNEIVINSIEALLNTDSEFISIDPKHLVTLIMNTNKESAIKLMLCKLFNRDKQGKWNSFDTAISVYYLISRKFMHSDLLNIIEINTPHLFQYYKYYCKQPFQKKIKTNFADKFYNTVFYSKDKKLFYLMILYRIEKSKGNYLASFAYYKNFFDRITAHIAFSCGYAKKKKEPNWGKFYKKAEHKKFYSDIPSSKDTIENADNYRNQNPLAHSSSELIDCEDTTANLSNCIVSLSAIIKEKIDIEFP